MQVESIAECSREEHSAILLTCIKQLKVLKTNFLSSFEWPLKTGLTIYCNFYGCKNDNFQMKHCNLFLL